MNFVNLKRQTFTVTSAGVTYSKEFYTPAISVTGVENETHPNWNATATYAEGAYVIVPELKSIYKSGLNNNTGIFPPSDSTSWTWWGFINSMNMFTCDENLGSQTVGTNVVVTIPFNQNNVLAIVDTNFSTVNIKQIDNDTNEVINDLDIISRDISCSLFSDIACNNSPWHFNMSLCTCDAASFESRVMNLSLLYIKLSQIFHQKRIVCDYIRYKTL